MGLTTHLFNPQQPKSSIQGKGMTQQITEVHNGGNGSGYMLVQCMHELHKGWPECEDELMGN
jgi:hypothetical protein